MARSRIGLWIIGAKGGVASTAALGLAALKKGLIGTAGLVSELPTFAGLDLANWNDFVLGGHEIRDVDSYGEAMRMHTESRAIDEEIVVRCKADLDRFDKAIRPGTVLNVGSTIRSLAGDAVRRRVDTPRGVVERVQEDLRSFARDFRLEHVIVVNLASTEPSLDAAAFPRRAAELARLIDKPRRCVLPASSLYAWAALDLGCSYVNFTPSLGSGLAAIDELARDRATRHMGHDGKTGETLLKSTLAPLFAKRNLQVMSWVGHNIFGNMDGKVLDDPENKKTKVASKDRLLGHILGYHPQTLVSIEYIQSLADWKTAWDHVHFKGFLGTPMTLQFIWQGCDSLLAAPLVLDLVRFTERAWRLEQTGLLTYLASFFKSPLGVSEHDFGRQYQMLEDWAETVRARVGA
jgi:myo-inositol-1-phosphate synthase